MIIQDGRQPLQNMNCKKSVKQNRNPIRLRILPFYTIIFTTAFKIIQIVGWLSQNHRTANPAREPHIIWQRPLLSLPPSHRAPSASFFFLPSLPTTQRSLCGGESASPVILQTYDSSSTVSKCPKNNSLSARCAFSNT